MLFRRFFLSCLMGAVVISGGFAEAQSSGERSSSGRAEVVAAGSRQGARPTGTSSLKRKSAKPSKTKAIKIPPPSAKSLRFMKKSFGLGSIKELRSFANTVGERCVLKIDLSQEHISCIPVAKDRSKHGFKFCQLQSKSPNKFPSCEVVPQMVRTKAVVGRKKDAVNRNLKSDDDTIRIETLEPMNSHLDGFSRLGGVSFTSSRPLGPTTSGSDSSSSNFGVRCNPGEKVVNGYENCSDDNDIKCKFYGKRDVLKCVPECPEGQKMTSFTEECSENDNRNNCKNSDANYEFGVKEVRRCASDPNYCPEGQHQVPTKILCTQDITGCTQADDGTGNFYKTIPQCASKPPVNKRDTTCPKGNKVVTKLENCHPNDAGCSDQGYIEVKECKLDNEFRCPLGHKAIIKSQTCSQGDLGCYLEQTCLTIAGSTECEVAHVEQIQECVKDPDYGMDINGCKPGEQWECDVEPCEYENGRPDPSGRCVPCQTEAQAAISIGDCLKINSDSDDGGASGAYIGQAIQECKARINSCIKKEAADNSQRDDKITQSKCLGEEALNPASGRCENACPDGKISFFGVCSCANGKSTNYFSKCSIDLPTRDQPTCVEGEYDNGQCRCSNGSLVQPGQSCSTTSQDKSWWDRVVSAITNTVKDIVSGLSGLVGSARDFGEEIFGSIRDRLSNIFGWGNTDQSGVGGSQGAGGTCPFGPGSHYQDPVAGWCGCPMGMEVVNGSCVTACPSGFEYDSFGNCQQFP